MSLSIVSLSHGKTSELYLYLGSNLDNSDEEFNSFLIILLDLNTIAVCYILCHCTNSGINSLS